MTLEGYVFASNIDAFIDGYKGASSLLKDTPYYGNSGNNPIRDYTQDYLNGQQTNAITNLTNQTLNDARQAQQGGSGSGGSGSGGDTQQGGSGGGSSTSQGVSAFNGGQNFPERLNYSRQAMAEQAETNFQGLLDYFNTDPIMQSILKDGKDSPYLSEVSPEIAEQIANIFKESYDIANNLQRLQNKEDYQNAYINLIGKLNESVSHLSDLLSALTVAGVEVLNDAASAVFNRVATLFTIMDVGAKETELSKMKLDFYNKYGVNIDEGIEIEYKKNLIAGTTRLTYPNYKIRDVDPVKYDEYIFKKIELDQLKSSALKGMVMLIVDAHAPAVVAALEVGGATAAAGAVAPILGVIGIIISADSHAQQATAKANYLSAAHVYEQSWELTYFEQLFGMKYGTVKGWFKGNENPSPSQNVIEPTSGISPKRLKASGLLLNAVATTPTLVFNGSAGNDTLFNIEDNYLISAGEGDDQISNIGDHVTIDTGNGNDYAANLGDNVSIIGGVGNNVIDNAGSNVIVNFADGNNYISNGGDYVTVTAGIGNNYVDNVGNSTGIWLGNGANDVENFGSNVTVNTGTGADFIVNYGGNTTVNAGSGKNVIFNSYGSNVLINTDKDDDYISVKEGSDRVTINAGNGSDTVINNGTNDLINLDAGNDFVYNDSLGSGATISGLDGNDSLENRAANVSINGGFGDNRFVNDGVAVTMTGGDGADTIANAGDEAFIDAGNGNNSIGNAGNTVSIFAGNGIDSILNEGANVTMSVAGGTNQIINKGSENSIILGSGNNTIQNYGEATHIRSVENDMKPSAEVSIAFPGDTPALSVDFIMNGAVETTIDSGNGDDTIINYFAAQVDDNENITSVLYNGNNSSINGGDGNDYIENVGAFGTITGGAGDDTIENLGFFLVDKNGNIIRRAPISNYYYQIDAGEGNNQVYNENENATITSGTGADLIENVSNNVNINAGNGSNTIANIGSTVKILSGSGNDSIETDAANVTISAGAGNDFIHNYSNGSNTTIDAGKGNDTISLEAGAQSNVITYKVGDGNKIIYGYNSTTTIKIIGSDFNTTQSGNDIIVKVSEGTITLKYVSNISDLNILVEDNIVGSEEADTINNRLNSAIVSALGGEDHIKNNGANVSINGGADNDSIENTAYGEYSYTTRTWSNVGTPNDVTINGGAGNDSITNYGGKRVKIDGKDDDDYIVNGKKPCDPPISETYELEAPPTLDLTPDTNKSNSSNLLETQSPVKNNGMENANLSNISDSTPEIVYSPDNATINGGLGNDTIHNEGTQALINGNEGNDYIGNTGEFVTINGGTGDDTIHNEGFYAQNNGNNTSISGGAGNDSLYNKEANNVTINAGKGNDSITNIASLVSINAGDNSDYISNSLIYGYSSERGAFTISPDNTTIDAGDGNDTISNHGDNVLINGGSGNDSISNTIYLEWNGTFIASPDDVTIDAGKGDDTIINEGNNALFIYSGGNDSIIGFNATSTLKIENDTDTYSKKTIGDDIVIIVDKGTITLKDATNLSNINIWGNEKPSWSLNGDIANYGNLFTLSGVKTTDGIAVDTIKKSVTLSADNLNSKNVTISGDYSLALSGVSASKSTTAHFNGLTYKSASKTAGYALSKDKKSITYTAAVAETDLFTISGVKSTDGIIVNDSNKTVTLKGGNLNGKEVTITGNYKLNLVKDVSTAPVKAVGSFTKFANGTATYKMTAYSDYYTLKNNKITYTAATGGKTIKIAGLNTKAKLATIKSSIKVVEQTDDSLQITFNNTNVLAAKAPTISADSGITYTLAVVDNLKPTELAPDWKVSGSNASLKADTSAGYSVVDNQIVYSKKKTGSAQLVLSGLTKNASLTSPVDKIVTLNTAVLGTSASLKSNAGNYSVKLTGNMSGKTFTGTSKVDTLNIASNNVALRGGAGNDNFTVSGSKVTLTGGKGNDNISLQKAATIIYGAGDGFDTVTYAKGMQISLSGSTEIKTLGKSDSNLVLGFGKNSSIRITGASSTNSLKVTSSTGSVTLLADKFDLAKTLTFNSKNSSVKVAKNFTGSLTSNDDIYLGGTKLSSVSTINASAVTGKVTISGNSKANTIFAGNNSDKLLGGSGNDSLIGNAGNDKIYGEAGNDSLRGGTGNDSLWGGDGKDIFIYEAGKDVIVDFTAGQDRIKIAKGKISKTSLNGSDVLFTIGKGSLTVKNAKGKTISLLDSTGKASSTVVGAQGLTNSNKASVTIASDMGIVDASKRSKAITITGNALANTISGGSKNDSIYGAAGNDSIVGNNGNDKLYGDAGNDILLGGKGNDSLWGGVGNDILTGNDGNDFFIYESGKDVISDYTAGQDKILIAGGKISKTSLNGSDVLFTIGKGSLTVKNAKGKTISLLDSSGKASSTVVGAQTLTNSNKASVTIGADMGAVDASARTKAISITGNALANTICGGSKNDSIFGAAGNDSILGNDGNDKLYGDAGNDILLGGKGNDSLWGGAGNDSLWGDAGKDIFIYTANEGTDTIFDYETGDLLKILNVGGSEGSFKSSKYSGGDLTLTINGGGKIIFEGVASSTKFNINGSSYNISGSKLIKK